MDITIEVNLIIIIAFIIGSYFVIITFAAMIIVAFGVISSITKIIDSNTFVNFSPFILIMVIAYFTFMD